jgi:glycolate oxidase
MSPLDELRAELGDRVVTDHDVLQSYSRDTASWAASGEPSALVRAARTEDVQTLARWATRHRVAIVPRGAGTGVAGGANASNGCVVLSFERMNRILELNADAMYAVVQPGVINAELKRAASERGLWYAPDPSSYEISTLGGNVATNAGGLCCLKYGVTRDYVLGLQAVLASGELVTTGGRCRKDVAGYDLTSLLVGSEGTLGLVTEIRLRLRRSLPPATTVIAWFGSLEAAGNATNRIVRTVDPSLLELMDRAAIAAVERFAGLGLVEQEAAALLLIQADSGKPEDLTRVREACEIAGAHLVYATDDEDEGKRLLQARRLAYPALERLGHVMIDDISVPLPHLPEMLRRIEATAKAHDVMVATVAHAGDGNIHPLIVFDPNDARATKRANLVFKTLMTEALDLGGTISGEHGIGSIKAGYLAKQLDATSMELHRTIKRAFDPLGILNPGKLLVGPEAPATTGVRSLTNTDVDIG